MKYFKLCGYITTILILSCNKGNNFDASGNFESDEVIVSAQQNGQLLSFNLNEGDTLTQGELVRGRSTPSFQNFRSNRR